MSNIENGTKISYDGIQGIVKGECPYFIGNILLDLDGLILPASVSTKDPALEIIPEAQKFQIGDTVQYESSILGKVHRGTIEETNRYGEHYITFEGEEESRFGHKHWVATDEYLIPWEKPEPKPEPEFEYEVFYGGNEWSRGLRSAPWTRRRVVEAKSHRDAICKIASRSQHSGAGTRYLAIGPGEERQFFGREIEGRVFEIADIDDVIGGYINNQDFYRVGDAPDPEEYDFVSNAGSYVGYYSVKEI